MVRETSDNSEIKAAQLRAEMLNLALRLLASRSHSVEELRARLLQKANPQIVESVIAELKEYNYLDDERFTTDFTASRLRQKAVGRHRLERELSMKNISREIAERVLDQLFEENSEEQLIDLSIRKHINQHGRPRNQRARKKMFDYLARLGYPYDLIIEKLNEIREATE